MKRIYSTVLLSLILSTLLAQSPDERIGELLNANDIFELEKEYPKLQNSIQVPMLNALTEAVLSASFNQQSKAVSAIDLLIDLHADEIGSDNTNNMLSLQHMILFRMGEYDKVAKLASDYVKQLKTQVNDTQMAGLAFYEKFFGCMTGQKKSELIRPDSDCEIPIFVEEINSKDLRKGHLLYVPVTIHGNEEKFIFDTGCPGGAFMTEDYARKYNVLITMDSLQVSGVGGSGWGKMGILDSINIGNMTFKNLVVTVVPPSSETDTILPISIDLVLGSDIMRHAGEVQIYPKEGKIIFPKQKTSLPATGRNIYINGGDHFFIKCYSGTERLIMHFDTGDSAAGLHANYFNRHKDEIEHQGTKESTKAGGFGGLINTEFYKLPNLPFKIGNKYFEIKDINIYPDNKAKVIQGNEDGSLGMAFIRLFNKVTINFDDMFVSVE